MTRRKYCLILSVLPLLSTMAPAEEDLFLDRVEPLLVEYCYNCHGDGMDKGDFIIDDYDHIDQRDDYFANHELWLKVWENTRAGMMPPADKKQPTPEETKLITQWIESRIFKLDPKNPDPGRVTVRRLNREEYRNTVYDLWGVRFNVDEAFPPDDTGYGFDTIGDVLSISPLLMEKYLEAAESIVGDIIPSEGGMIPVRSLSGKALRKPDNQKISAHWLDFKYNRTVEGEQWLPGNGKHEIEVEYQIHGSDEATEHTAKLELLINDTVVKTKPLAWDFSKSIKMKHWMPLTSEKHKVALRITEDQKPEEGQNELTLNVKHVKFTGPLDGSVKEYSSSMKKIFFDGIAEPTAEGRRPYAREILRRQATKAFRRPVDEGTLDRLVEIAMQADATPDVLFEEAIRQAMIAILVSPRFLFRAEIQAEPDNPGKIVPVDQYALASRLSFFLWNSTPDDKLLELAGKGELRNQLHQQIDRMLADWKSERFVNNFVGQWLQTRDVDTINIDARRILGIRDLGDALRQFSTRLRQDMERETMAFFTYILKEDKPATELLTADYAFLNQRLADWYGVKGVEGEKLQKVALKPEHNRGGGLLTQGSFLVVTSNPTRTSPVKRGLFVLENLLATPPPPAPPDVPELEEARKEVGKKKLSMREMMVIHAEKPLCSSCHKRMDPIGLALENYNPVGKFISELDGVPIDASGELMTGEQFNNAADLARVLATEKRVAFHRAISEKLMTFALGRGTEYFDGPTIDRLVDHMESQPDGGTLRDLIYGIVDSVPFQKRRGDGHILLNH